ncbi:hypothetical protein OBBRIDRAFT_798146 [Obba rivulosa]|uniref:Uncharacterized protein n=1 Tax=Obba rivulosa TaxID=1052685 RepID=A0A8E2ARP8_9APHY|nr:hypothetical protein OBBRIDRAFT_798146 [Obba rivulosa]
MGTHEKTHLETARKHPDVGDIPLGSPDSYHEAPEQHLIVDFAVLRTRVHVEDDALYDNGLGNIYVDYLRMPMLVECKPRPSRTQSDAHFKRKLGQSLLAARMDLYDQATLVFFAFQFQRSVVVVATAGEYWMYGQWERDWVIHEWSGSEGQISDESESSQDDEKKDATYVPEAQGRRPTYTPREEVFAAPDTHANFRRGNDFGYGAPRKGVAFADLYKTESDLKNSWQVNGCSGVMSLEQPQSNQGFYLLHEHLAKVAAQLDDFSQG